MDVKDYCNFINTDLTAWKAKMYNLGRRLEKVDIPEKEKISPKIEELHKLIAEMDELTEQLSTECPIDWSPIKKKIEDAQSKIRSTFEEDKIWGRF